MPTVRTFAYNSGTGVTGTTQVGYIAAGATADNYGAGLTWWKGPDEDLGYVICGTSGARTAGQNAYVVASPTIGFLRSTAKTDPSFLSLCSVIAKQTFADAASAKTWLNSNGYWTSYPSAPSDAIRAALSTSVSAYDAATVGNFIKVTAAEYANVVSTVTGTTKYVMNDTDLTSAFGGWTTGYNVSYNDTSISTAAIPTSNYIIGYAYSGGFSTPITTYLRAGTTVNGTHSKIGSNVTFTDNGAKTVYFIRKAPTASTASKVYLSFYTTGGGLGQVVGKSNYPVFYSLGADTNTWTVFTGGYPTLQALATTTKSW
jgi:hypothetical protein